MTQAFITRVLDPEIEGAINLRDLGGLPVEGGVIRTGMVFRSAMMHHISQDGLRQLAEEHRLRTVVDLRNETELEADGLCDFAPAGITHRHIPVTGETALTPPEERAERIRGLLMGEISWAESYMRIATESGHTYREFFEVLADPTAYSLVFHCSGGRDRTGIGAGLLLAALGAEDEIIAADYARTGELLRGHAHRFGRVAEEIGMSPDEMSRLVSATEPEAMFTFLGTLRDEFGSIDGYLDWVGVSKDVLEAVRHHLIAPAG